eukprot:1920519-Rhodomonas_salina.1
MLERQQRITLLTALGGFEISLFFFVARCGKATRDVKADGSVAARCKGCQRVRVFIPDYALATTCPELRKGAVVYQEEEEWSSLDARHRELLDSSDEPSAPSPDNVLKQAHRTRTTQRKIQTREPAGLEQERFMLRLLVLVF